MPEGTPLDPTAKRMMSPVEDLKTKEVEDEPAAGVALCLSGGGYRAMMFHTGALWRLAEAGWLERLDRVSSVSGGSITAAVLGAAWSTVKPGTAGSLDRFKSAVVAPIRALASRNLDAKAILGGALLPGTIADWIADAYDKYLFGGKTLQSLPDFPRFVINATNVQSGALWRFMKPYMRDYRVGEVRSPEVPLATAVAASSAFPPFLSPMEIELNPASFTPNSGKDLQFPPYTTEAVLTDGGVYDNLGLETAWKRYRTILVSDAGGRMAAEPNPKRDWVRHVRRVLDVVDNQVRSLRKRQVIDSFKSGSRLGSYWGIRTNIRDYGLQDPLPCPHDSTMKLAAEPTRLRSMDSSLQERLINWGYAVCDAAMRRHVDPALTMPTGFPFPTTSVG